MQMTNPQVRFPQNLDENRRVWCTTLILIAIIALLTSAALIEKYADTIDPARAMAKVGGFFIRPLFSFMM